MIIQLLGANGAGKSTIVQGIMGDRWRSAEFVWGRSRPDGYRMTDVGIVGHYEGDACGGGDTVPRDRVVETIRAMRQRMSVPLLIEGPTGREPSLLLLVAETPEPFDLRVVHLRRELESNLSDWMQRSRAKGLSCNRAIMQRRIRAATTRCDNLASNYMAAGIPVTTTASRNAARATIERLLGRQR